MSENRNTTITKEKSVTAEKETIIDIDKEVAAVDRRIKEVVGTLLAESEAVYTPVNEIDNTYYVTQAKNIKCISNFVMKPLTLIEGVDGGIYTIQFMHSNGKITEKQFKSSVLSSVRTFKQVINKDNAELSFMGTDIDLENVKIYMFNKYPNYERKTGVDHVGIIKHKTEWLFIDKEKAINAFGVQNLNISAFITIEHIFENKLTKSEPIGKDDLLLLSTRLFQFNKVTRTIPIIAWCAACFLKERLSRRKIKLSNLLIHGSAGSGKSDTSTGIIMPLFGMVNEPLSCSNIKEFALLKVCSSNNLFPVILDEYKPAKLGSIRVDLISRTLRSAYDGHRTDRGHQDQTITSYQYRAPIALIGESSIEEKAIKERSIEVLYGKLDRTKEHTENYFYLKKNSQLLNRLGKALLFQALQLSDKDLDIWIKESERFQGLKYETRNVTGLSVLYLGMKLIKSVYQERGFDINTLNELDDDGVEKALIQNLEESLDMNGKSKTAVEQIVEAFDIMASKKLIIDNVHYATSQETNEIQLYVNHLYPEFVKYYRDYNLSNEIEYLNKADFTKQLRGTEYFVTHAGRTFKDKTTNIIKKYKCFILDLKMVSEKLETEIFMYEQEENNGKFITAEQVKLPFEQDQK